MKKVLTAVMFLCAFSGMASALALDDIKLMAGSKLSDAPKASPTPAATYDCHFVYNEGHSFSSIVDIYTDITVPKETTPLKIDGADKSAVVVVYSPTEENIYSAMSVYYVADRTGLDGEGPVFDKLIGKPSLSVMFPKGSKKVNVLSTAGNST